MDDDPHARRHVREALAAAGYAPVATGEPGQVSRWVPPLENECAIGGRSGYRRRYRRTPPTASRPARTSWAMSGRAGTAMSQSMKAIELVCTPSTIP